MAVRALGYIGIGATDIAAWRSFAADVLGVETNDTPDGGLQLRVDTRAWRIAIEPGGDDDIAYAGWEVGGAVDFDAQIAKIETAGISVARDDALAAKRGVLALASFTDPAGIACELFYGATDLPQRMPVSPTGVSGFVTGDQGLGHIVIGTAALDATHAFYRDVLGFGYSDFIAMPVGPGMTIPVHFMHCNTRHHSFAFAPPPPGAPKLIHFMLQVASIDDVGFALDRVQKASVELAMTLGRHANDQMLSFYAYTPSGFEIEYGWGARTIDRATWLPVRNTATSSWGHKFVGHGAPSA